VTKKINAVVICCHVDSASNRATIDELISFLNINNIKVFLEKTAYNICNTPFAPIDFDVNNVININSVKQIDADLFVVIGGDGSMLGTCRDIAKHNIPVIGINKGHLGFLTDLDPENFKENLTKVINSEYTLEQRFFLKTSVLQHNKIIHQSLALNEAVVHSEKSAHMIDFSIYVSDAFMYSQKADGIIISTPTGSTAYNLSAGGPIIEPSLDVISVVPMFPHSMNCRPFIVGAQNVIKIAFAEELDEDIIVSCDGQIVMEANRDCVIEIQKCPISLCICHPHSYDYYKVLRSKLGFASKFIN
jgi:NAD+ kinase